MMQLGLFKSRIKLLHEKMGPLRSRKVRSFQNQTLNIEDIRQNFKTAAQCSSNMFDFISEGLAKHGIQKKMKLVRIGNVAVVTAD